MMVRLDKRNWKIEKLKTIDVHKNAKITSFAWSPLGAQLFIGDDKGKVTSTGVPESATKGLFSVSESYIVYPDLERHS